MLGSRYWNREAPQCLHQEIVTVVTAGLERVICDNCGLLSFRYPAELSGGNDRSHYGRVVDRFAMAH